VGWKVFLNVKLFDCGWPCTYAIVQTTQRPDLLKIDPTVAYA